MTYPDRRFRAGWLLSVIVTLFAITGCSDYSKPYATLEVAVRGSEAAAISDDGKFLSLGSVEHGGSLWKLSSRERLYSWNHKEGEYSTIVATDFSPDGDWAVTAEAHTIVLWSVKDGQAIRYWTAPGEILSIALSAYGEYALLGLSDGSAVLFDIRRGGIKRRFQHDNRVRSVALSDNGRLALTGSEDNTARLWDMASGRQLHLQQHQEDVQVVALSPDGQIAFSAAKYDQAIVWRTDDGKTLGQIPLAAEKLKRGLRFTTAKFNKDGSRLLTGRPDQIVQLWNTRSMTLQQGWRLPKRNAWEPTGAAVLAVAFSGKSGQYLATASNGLQFGLKREK